MHQFTQTTVYGPIILYDGECAACSHFVQFVVGRDTKKRFLFSRRTSKVARKILGSAYDPFMNTQSIAVVTSGQVLIKSEAIIYIAESIDIHRLLIWAARSYPLRIRDAIYDYFASRRKLFGGATACAVLPADTRARILD